MRDSIVFYRSFYDAIKGLPPEDFKKCTCAILEYGFDGIEPDSEGIEQTVFRLTKPQIDANQRKYENGLKGGRPKNQDKAKANQNKTKAKPKQTNPEPNVNDNDNVNVNDNDNVNENEDKNSTNNSYIHDPLSVTMYSAKE